MIQLFASNNSRFSIYKSADSMVFMTAAVFDFNEVSLWCFHLGIGQIFSGYKNHNISYLLDDKHYALFQLRFM